MHSICPSTISGSSSSAPAAPLCFNGLKACPWAVPEAGRARCSSLTAAGASKASVCSLAPSHACHSRKRRPRGSGISYVPPGALPEACEQGHTVISRELASCVEALVGQEQDALPLMHQLNPLQIFLMKVAASAVISALVVAWHDRPRGWCSKDLVQVKDSYVAGKGVFARKDIPKGTRIGAYPGRPRSVPQILIKAETAPAAKGFAFHTSTGQLLDPTDSTGSPSERPQPGMPWLWRVDHTLAFVNEPPPGRSTNVEVGRGNSKLDLPFIATRDIEKGEELFIDYGGQYDRTSYGTSYNIRSRSVGTRRPF